MSLKVINNFSQVSAKYNADPYNMLTDLKEKDWATIVNSRKKMDFPKL